MNLPSAEAVGDHFAEVVVELAPDGIAVTDELGRIVYVNSRFEQLFGYGRDHLVGHPVEMLVPEHLRARHRGHRHDYERQPTARSMGTRPAGGELELLGRHADGRQFPVEVALSPVTTATGIRTIMTVRHKPEHAATSDRLPDQESRAAADQVGSMADALDGRVLRPILSASLRLHQLLATATVQELAALYPTLEDLDRAVTGLGRIVHDASRGRRTVDIDLTDTALAGADADQVPPTEPGTVVEWWIDGDDVVTQVGEGYRDFAVANGAPELAEPDPGRTLWSFIDGEEVRALWRLLVLRVRIDGTEAHVPLRCDAPDRRRWFHLVVTPEDHERVRFRSTLVFEHLRLPVALLDATARTRRGGPAVPVCAWCERAFDGTQWVDVERYVRERGLHEGTALPAITHAVCATCRELMSAEVLQPR